MLERLSKKEKVEIFLLLIMETDKPFHFNGNIISFPISTDDSDKIELFLRNKLDAEHNYELIYKTTK